MKTLGRKKSLNWPHPSSECGLPLACLHRSHLEASTADGHISVPHLFMATKSSPKIIGTSNKVEWVVLAINGAMAERQ